jgi:glycerate dehydrogenase
MKIVFLDAFTVHPDEIDLNVFKTLGEFIFYDRTPKNLVWERAHDAEIILTNKTILDKDILGRLPLLKYIGITATGFNVVDIKAANDLGITVTNARDYSTNSVAQQVLAMILSFSNQLSQHDGIKKWSSQPDFCYYSDNLFELSGKTMGLIGFGNIAKKVSTIAHAFGMKILVYKPSPIEQKPEYIEESSLDFLLNNADTISLHCPLTDDNQQFINLENLKKMKKNAILINTARGGLINESDLKIALENDIIGGAYLDVLSVEPPADDHILLNTKNLKISPHIAWASIESRQRLIDIVYHNLHSFLEGKPVNILP